ncbi:MAG: formyltransferase family protein, partial [Bacteroidota bacterium]
MTRPINIALFASGTGSNAKKIIDYFQGHPSVECALLVSNKKTAPALEMAAERGVETRIISRDYFYKSQDILDLFAKKKIDWIVLAG